MWVPHPREVFVFLARVGVWRQPADSLEQFLPHSAQACYLLIDPRSTREARMLVLFVLLISWLAFRLLGGFGVPIFLSWHESLRYALAVMFLFTSVAHFNRMKHDLARMIPAWMPNPLFIVYLTGLLEFAGAIGLLFPPPINRIAAYCLIALVIPMFLGNVHAVREGVTLRGKPVTPLWLRAPMQILFIALLYWSARP